MHKYGAAVFTFALTCALAACGGRDALVSGTGAGFAPSLGLHAPALLPKNTIGEELPGEGVGTKTDPTWGLVGGFTQTSKAQVLAFPPGSKITIRNLSRSIPHTLNVVVAGAKPPAKFPSNPTLSFAPKGNGKLALGYASGQINPGSTVSVTLSKAGTYLIGCAFHYSEGMRDVIRVVAGATPGPSTISF